MSFHCTEFAGCEPNFCAYEGEEDCHWRNVPVENCGCQSCFDARLAIVRIGRDAAPARGRGEGDSMTLRGAGGPVSEAAIAKALGAA